MKKRVTISVILLASLFLRTFRISDLLGFWYDQGRDALVIWNLWHNHHPFLIGPTTGIEGIFLGPFYYYFIAPFYLIGKGNPVIPAIWLAIVTTAAIWLLYRLGSKYFSPTVGLISAILYGFSAQFVSYNRWLSNPTALPFFALVAIWCLLEIIHGSSRFKHWAALGLCLGLSLQLEAASAIFFLPSAIILLLVFRKSLSRPISPRLLSISFFFLITLIPQVWFNIRNQNILISSFSRFLFSEKSFQTQVTNMYSQRLSFYREIFTNKFSNEFLTQNLMLITFAILFILAFYRIPKKPLTTTLIWWATPTLILLFYHGNKGYVWDYYFTGAYPALVLLISAVLVKSYQNMRWARGVVVILLGIFLYQNFDLNWSFFRQTLPAYISLTHIRQAVDWVYHDTSGVPFNTDVYVPPQISYSYDYVFLWRGITAFHTIPSVNLVPRLYTLLEPDNDHPQLREKWLTRQDTIGKIDQSLSLGPILVQRRIRLQSYKP